MGNTSSATDSSQNLSPHYRTRSLKSLFPIALNPVSVDGGTTVSKSSLYPNLPKDIQERVSNAIISKKLAPFYTSNQATEAESELTECPICFLNYPMNINWTRCCSHSICTECFIQIKRNESNYDPATCPYCVQPMFGIVYHPQGTPGFTERWNVESEDIGKRRKSVGFSHPSVLTSDDLRPGWQDRKKQGELKRALEIQRVALSHARRRQMEALRFERCSFSIAQSAIYSGSAETRGFQQSGTDRINPAMRFLGADVEEMMMMEAMRRSLQDRVESDTSREEREAIERSLADMRVSTEEPTVPVALAVGGVFTSGAGFIGPSLDDIGP